MKICSSEPLIPSYSWDDQISTGLPDQLCLQVMFQIQEVCHKESDLDSHERWRDNEDEDMMGGKTHTLCRAGSVKSNQRSTSAEKKGGRDCLDLSHDSPWNMFDLPVKDEV